MKSRLLAVLVALSLLATLSLSFAVPAMAAAPVLTSITPNQLVNVPSFITNKGYFVYTGVTFHGTFNNPPTAVSVSGDGLVTVGSFGNVTTSSFTATVTVASPAAHGPRDVTVTTIDGVSNVLYSGISVGEFPYPSNSTGAQVVLSMTPYYDAAGGSNITSPGTTPITTAVIDGTTVWYQITLSQTSSSAMAFMGGQIAIRFPHNPPGTTYIPVAGYGPATSAHPDIPEITLGSPFSVFAPVAYTANATDTDVHHVLTAEADYGVTRDNPSQISGIVEGSGPTTCDASITSALLLPPVPELPAGFLFGIGLAGLGGFIVIKKTRKAPAR